MVQPPAGDTSAVARVTTMTKATPAEVFELLANGWRYADWVMGSKRIREVEPGWPAVGTRFHHVVGYGPVSVHDCSVVEEADPDRRFVLTVRAWPAGQARVVFELEPVDGGTRITMDEVPTAGPARNLYGRVLDTATHVRNIETLRRLRRAVEETRLARQ